MNSVHVNESAQGCGAVRDHDRLNVNVHVNRGFECESGALRLRVSAGTRAAWCSGWAVVSCRVKVSQRLPALRGSNQRVATPATYHSDLPGAHAERSPRPLVLSPFGFCGSRRQWVVNPRTRVSGARAVQGQPAPVSTRAPGARDHCRPLATSPRVYKSLTWSPRPLQGNRPPCLQKFLDLDPSRATGPRVWSKSFCPRLQRATSPRVCKSSSKTGTPGDNQSHSESSPPRLVKKKN